MQTLGVMGVKPTTHFDEELKKKCSKKKRKEGAIPTAGAFTPRRNLHRITPKSSSGSKWRMLEARWT
jgi:hypothetical protein